MVLTYSGRSALGAGAIAAESEDIILNRGNRGDINWGRAMANTELNPDITNCTNKRLMRELFKRHNVPTPRLLSYEDMVLLFQRGKAVVGRPDKHMRGRGFWLCHNMADVEKAMRGTRKKKAATHFMEYISAPREYRVHIFKDKSIRISEKAHTAFHEYTTIKPEHNVNHVRKAAKQAVSALGLDFGAVDILADNDDCWVTEVNAAPGLGGSMPRLYAEVFQRWLDGDWDD